MKTKFLSGFLAVACSLLVAACNPSTHDETPKPGSEKITPNPITISENTWSGANTCSGVYPSYWQDPAPKFAEQWEGQTISNQAPAGYDGRIFQISDNYGLAASFMDEDTASHVWRDSKFDPMFDPDIDQGTKTKLAKEYVWALMDYIQEGNVDTNSNANTDMDWNICTNKVRPWIHNPYQTYNVMTGRDFTHGLTREAPFTFDMQGDSNLSGAIWAVGFFNPGAASVFAEVWQDDGTPIIPTSDLSFPEGAVIGKLLFASVTSEYMPMMNNLPSWQASTSGNGFCGCTPADGETSCTMAEESQQCQRSLNNNPVTLLQFDVAVKDRRAPGTEWVFATFVADGERKSDEPIAWRRISPLGVMWGNDPMPNGELASGWPEDPRESGFGESVIFWDTVDMLNDSGGADQAKWPGHLGCNSRLNGPADKAYSTCMSCHMTASVADSDIKVPPLAPQFGGVTSQCALEGPDGKWIDAGGSPAKVVNDVTYPEMDSVYFRNINASAPFDPMTYNGKNVYPGRPNYANGSDEWVALDFSLQLSISLVQWKQWQQHKAAHDAETITLAKRIHSAKPPRR